MVWNEQEVGAIMIKKILIGLCFIGLGLILKVANAEAPERLVSEFTVPELVSYYSAFYGASEVELFNVGTCESNLRQVTNPNDGGSPSIGIFQYKVGTFARYSKMLGEELDINSIHDQIKLTSYIFAEHPKEKRAWTCARTYGYA